MSINTSLHIEEIPWENGCASTPVTSETASALFTDVIDSVAAHHTSFLDGCLLGLEQEKNQQNLHNWVQHGGDQPTSYRQDAWDAMSNALLWQGHHDLDFSDSRFIPDILDDKFLVDAQTLYAKRNQCTSLPDSFHATRFHTLILSNSAISSLPDATSSAWAQLSELYIDGCRNLSVSSVISFTFLRPSCAMWFNNTVFADLLPENLRYDLEGQPISRLLQCEEIQDLLDTENSTPFVFK